MPQNIEIEFKNMLSKEEFTRLLTVFHLTHNDFIRQENHYFDTSDFSLKNIGCALRIRKKRGQFEMTLKEPHPEGLLETNEKLSEEQAQNILKNGKLYEGIIKSQIIKLGIDIENLHYFGTLETERTEFPYEGGLLVLDASSYLNLKDYEVEYEVNNREQGQAIFYQFLANHNIPIRQTNNKVKRFYEALKRKH
ncbi:CYTH domain-containing protein [Niallia oryzisoli]|uniref:CYTH domain-containing protein n=1 Tax=Niallia oryzisoli TaxID=1737571 RepID=A0ABZ2C8V2_9BACI